MKCEKHNWKRFKYFFLINLIQFGIDFYYTANIGVISSFIYSDWKEDTGLNFESDLSATIFVGLLTQLIIGAISDRCTSKFGRRRIFMAIGTVIAIVSQFLSICLMFVPMKEIENINSPNEISNGNSMRHGTFWLLFALARITSIGINMIQVGYRAFILDEFDAEYQLKVYSLSALQMTLSQFVYSFLYLFISVIVFAKFNSYEIESSYSDNFHEDKAKLPYYFLPIQILSIPILLVTMILFWKSANETKYDGVEKEKKLFSKCKGVGKDICNVCGSKQPMLYFLFLIVLFGWICYYSAKDKSEQMIHEITFSNCSEFGEMMQHAIIQFITSICGVLFGIIVYKASNKIERLMLYGFGICGLSMFLYFIQPEQKYDKECLKEFGNWPVWIYMLPQCILPILICFLNSLPYAMLRTVSNPEKFGVSVGYVNSGVSIGQAIAVGLLSFIPRIIMDNLQFKENETVLQSEVYLSFYRVQMLFVICLFIVTFILFFWYNRIKFTSSSSESTYIDVMGSTGTNIQQYEKDFSYSFENESTYLKESKIDKEMVQSVEVSINDN